MMSIYFLPNLVGAVEMVAAAEVVSTRMMKQAVAAAGTE